MDGGGNWESGIIDAGTRQGVQRRTAELAEQTRGPASRLRFASAFAPGAPARPRRSSKSGVGSARRAGARGAEAAAGLSASQETNSAEVDINIDEMRRTNHISLARVAA